MQDLLEQMRAFRLMKFTTLNSMRRYTRTDSSGGSGCGIGKVSTAGGTQLMISTDRAT